LAAGVGHGLFQAQTLKCSEPDATIASRSSRFARRNKRLRYTLSFVDFEETYLQRNTQRKN
jgi:hypothetical protein